MKKRLIFYVVSWVLWVVSGYIAFGVTKVGTMYLRNNTGRTILFYVQRYYDDCGNLKTNSSGSVTLTSGSTLALTGNQWELPGAGGCHNPGHNNPFDILWQTNGGALLPTIEGPMSFTADGQILSWTASDGSLPAPTNATFTAVVCNPNGTAAMAYFKLNGATVHTQPLRPGECAQYNFNYNPQTDRLDYGYTSGVPVPAFSDTGELIISNNLSDVPVGTTYGTNVAWGGASGTNLIVGTDYRAGWTNLANNGPINFTGDNSSTAAKDDTLRAGFNAVVGNQQLELILLGRIAAQTSSSSGGVVVTNTSDVTAYLETNKASMRVDASTANATVGGQQTAGTSSAGSALSGSGWTAVKDSGLSGVGGVSASDSSGETEEFTITGAGVSHTMSLTTSDSKLAAFEVAKKCAAWFIVFVLLMKMWKHLYDSTMNLFTIPQATTAGDSILGTNANLVFAEACAAVIVAVVMAVPTALTAYLTTQTGDLSSIGNPVDGIGAVTGGGFVLKYVPVATMVSAVVTWFVFRVTADFLSSTAAIIIKLLTGV